MVEHVDTDEQNIEKFTIVKSIQSCKIKQVKRKLPQWLSNSSQVNFNTECHISIEELSPSLNQHLLQKLKNNNISTLFPVQSLVIKEILLGSGELGALYGRLGFRPRDLCCSAPTGSGKTLAYVLPIIQVLSRCTDCNIRCLVVLPTADLASQVFQVFSNYAQGLPLKIGLLNGLKTFQAEQSKIINNGISEVDVIVATPGRLVDHINLTPNFNLKHLRFLVLDEADRMMDEVKQDWLRHVEEAIHKAKREGDINKYEVQQRLLQSSDVSSQENINSVFGWEPTLHLQKLLFSATLSHDPEKFNQLKLFQPKLLMESSAQNLNVKKVIKPNKTDEDEDHFEYITPSSLREIFVESDVDDKVCVLLHLYNSYDMQQVLCFTNSTETAHRLFELLKLMGYSAAELSSRLHITRRTRLLQQFQKKVIKILVCTDSMCRGMDVAGVDWVINYDVPRHERTYVHRAGRTARANQTGTCISIVLKKEIFYLKKMMSRRLKELKVKPSKLKTLREQLQPALQKLKNL